MRRKVHVSERWLVTPPKKIFECYPLRPEPPLWKFGEILNWKGKGEPAGGGVRKRGNEGTQGVDGKRYENGGNEFVWSYPPPPPSMHPRIWGKVESTTNKGRRSMSCNSTDKAVFSRRALLRWKYTPSPWHPIYSILNENTLNLYNQFSTKIGGVCLLCKHPVDQHRGPSPEVSPRKSTLWYIGQTPLHERTVAGGTCLHPALQTA